MAVIPSPTPDGLPITITNRGIMYLHDMLDPLGDYTNKILQTVELTTKVFLSQLHPNTITDLQKDLNTLQTRIQEIKGKCDWQTLLALLPAARVYWVELVRRSGNSEWRETIKMVNKLIGSEMVKFPLRSEDTIQVVLEILGTYRVRLVFHENADIEDIVDKYDEIVQQGGIIKGLSKDLIHEMVTRVIGLKKPYPSHRVRDFNNPMDINGYDFTKDEDFEAYDGRAQATSLSAKEYEAATSGAANSQGSQISYSSSQNNTLVSHKELERPRHRKHAEEAYCMTCYNEVQEMQEDTIEALDAEIRIFKTSNGDLLDSIFRNP